MPTLQRKPRASKVSLIVSLVFHGAIIGALIFFAAREGYLGKQLKTIAVTMAPKPKPPEPEKPKEPEKPPTPPPEKPPQTEPPPVVAPPPVVRPATENRAPAIAPAVAPPPVGLPAFQFTDGAKAVDSNSNPIQLYKNYVEFQLRSKWIRPEGINDREFLVEVDVTMAPTGQILASTLRGSSGHKGWDDSVRRALAQTASIPRPPPKGFPGQFLVRFDVVEEEDVSRIALP